MNGWGSAGTWPAAKIVSVRVFASGATSTTANDIGRAVAYCTQFAQVRVINLSIAQATGSDADWLELEELLRDARGRGLNVVAGAGNAGGGVERPASLDSVLSVGAVDSTGALCSFSARGSDLDIAAPGCGLTGASQAGVAAIFEGTSFATPMVGAVLLALRDAENLDAAAAEARLLALADHTREVPTLRAQDGATTAAPAAASQPQPAAARPGSVPTVVDSPVTRRPRRPMAVARCRSSRLVVRVSSRPVGAIVEIRARSVRGQAERNRVARRVFQCPRRVKVRFVTVTSWSKWAQVSVRRR